MAELTGHLIGDGCLTDVADEWVYGGDDIDDGLADSHEGLLRELVGGVSRQQMQNGTVQLRAGSEAVRELFRGLGVTTARAHEKRVPAAVFTAPAEVQAAFLRGLFGADGCVSRVESAARRTATSASAAAARRCWATCSAALAFGIRGRIYRVSDAGEADRSPTRATTARRSSTCRGEGFDLRITGSDLARFAEEIGFSTPRKQAALESLLGETTRYATKRARDARRRARTTARRTSTTSPSRCTTPTSSTAYVVANC